MILSFIDADASEIEKSKNKNYNTYDLELTEANKSEIIDLIITILKRLLIFHFINIPSNYFNSNEQSESVDKAEDGAIEEEAVAKTTEYLRKYNSFYKTKRIKTSTTLKFYDDYKFGAIEDFDTKFEELESNIRDKISTNQIKEIFNRLYNNKYNQPNQEDKKKVTSIQENNKIKIPKFKINFNTREGGNKNKNKNKNKNVDGNPKVYKTDMISNNPT